MSHITLITGSTLGGAEYVGDQLAEILEADGHQTKVINEADISDLKTCHLALIITSTHGAGDFPETLETLMEQLETQKPDLSGLKYGIIAIGDSSYDTFCGAGRKADSRLKALGAMRIGERLEVDVCATPMPEEPAEAWLSQWKNLICE
ncbi:FMN-binding protein MioC [Parasalinivibrio latis]|uniref:FMN-binding protein MioC n=1 Tax=Parasalinivibrio latis TaxID=2952610 RepID=UPI0030E4F717